jgi:small-conductance mechanosensitive channel/CRP-like cAMP-binding protein
MPLQGVPLALLGLVAAGIFALLLSLHFVRDRIRRKLISSALMFLFTCALIIVIDDFPGWLDIEPGDTLPTVLWQVVSSFWWLSLAVLAIRITEVLLWRGLFSAQVVPKLLKDVLGAAYFIVAVFGIVAFVFEQPVTGLLATSGVVAVVLGFALQNTLGDVFSGIALNMEHPYRQGDWIQLDSGIEGEVVEINWRATHLRSRMDTEIIEPNAGMATARIVNFHYPDAIYAFTIQVRLGYRVPPARAKAVLKAAALACDQVLRDPAPIPRILSFEESYVVYDLKVWVEDYGEHPDHLNDVLTKVWEHLRWADISVAFPQRDIHLYEQEEREEYKSLAVADLLSQIDLFASLQEDETSALAAQLDMRQIKAGQMIVEQGAAGSSLYVIAEGLLEVRVRFDEDDAERVVAKVGPGECFGEMSLLTGAPRSASVVALTDAVIYKIEKIHLEPLLKARPQIAESLVELLSRRQEATQAIAQTSKDAAAGHSAAQGGYAEQLLDRIRIFFQL